MPITRSAKKARRQSIRRKVKNVEQREAYKVAVKTYKKLVLAKSLDSAREKLAAVYKALDKAAKTGAIKKGKAARLKSRLAKKLDK
ncbi:MAG: 30S ribosomal protein S20 [Patescibacteria group bacterium]